MRKARIEGEDLRSKVGGHGEEGQDRGRGPALPGRQVTVRKARMEVEGLSLQVGRPL